ncbi:hypothetical protein DPEC_G00304840 [Dallia pectoralis]|uniref:Uncharacterized protein n=1 Tax=Dallia pectoralis TaxID=75939 RepID=A0ACC2FDN1_DALPE|nr:hypothetical protein DPEC_G00304840 [Dallia pectoralis]
MERAKMERAMMKQANMERAKRERAKMKQANMERAERQQPELDEALSTLFKILEAMVDTHEQEPQSLDLQVPRGPVGTRDSVKAGTQLDSAHAETVSSVSGRVDNDTSTRMNNSQKRDEQPSTIDCPGGIRPNNLDSKRKRKRKPENADKMMAPEVPLKRKKESDPFTNTSMLKRSFQNSSSVNRAARKRKIDTATCPESSESQETDLKRKRI